ncbi:hypothetical protein MKZ38_000970 [Zalerion maritima]|uniref:Cytochrome b561 domain-containing protein n=1 Tax=Zalerion maritima TaxID=339359 RepID=A0AAD5RQV1_9PEZI|nr:hypothetical protein MKZ38_000970 [Zalerion maritima]
MDSHRWKRVVRAFFVYLPAIVFVIGLAAYVDAPERLYRATRRSETDHPLSKILSRRTIDALESDEQLRAAYVSVLSTAAASISDLAVRFPDIPQISAVSDILSSHYSTAVPRSSSESSLDVGRRDILSDLFKPIGDLFSGITDGISLQGPAFFLGVGLGEGASQGLNLSTADGTKAVANSVIAANNETPSGLNPALQDAAKGAAATLLGSLDISSLINTDPGQLPKIALGLAEGLGNGTASGLALSERAAALSPPNSTEIPDIVGIFGFGLSKSIASNVDLQGGGGIDLNSILGDVGLGTVAMVAGEGIGNGTATGLGISNNGGPATTGKNLVDAVGGFTFGLSKSLVGGIDLQNGFSLTGGNDSEGGLDIVSMLPSAAMGLGRGLSEGVGIGLGVDADEPVAIEEMPEGQIDIGGATRNFARGLTAGLLSNGTAMKIVTNLGASDNGTDAGVFGDVDIGRVAQGLARGMLQGVGDGIDSVGGVQAIVDGEAALPADMEAAMNITLDFDDSVNGAASGLGLGLGNQGVLVVVQVVQSMKEQAGALARRWLFGPKATPESGLYDETGLVPRQEASDDSGIANIPLLNGTLNFNVSNIITANAITSVAQGAVDALTCQGVGGIASISQGLMKSGIIPDTGGDTSTTNDSGIEMLKQLIPEGTIKLTNEGNNFGINLKQGIETGDLGSAVTVNSNAIAKFLAFIIIHILFAIIIFLNALPAALGLESTRNILDSINKPYVLPNSRRWVNLIWVFLVLPGTILVLVFGSLTMGSASHFRTAHGIFGLILTILALAATALHYLIIIRNAPSTAETKVQQSTSKLPMVRNALNQILLALAAIATFTGFNDLASISLCLVHAIGVEMGIMAGFALAGVWTVGQAVSGLDGYLMFREWRQRKKGGERMAAREKGQVTSGDEA